MATALALGLGSLAPAYAQVPDGYLEKNSYRESFETASSTSSLSTYPVGWNRFTPTSSKISYKVDNSGKEGKCIVASAYNPSSVAYDFIVTPEVKGTISFYIKKYSTSTTYPIVFEVYELKKTEDGFTYSESTPEGTPLYTVPSEKWDELTNSTTWTDVSFDAGENYKFLGFRINNAYIDEFEATSAIIPIKKELAIGTTTLVGGNTTSANADNTVDIKVDAVITNNGNVKMSKETEGENYTLSLVRYLRWENGGNLYETPAIATVDLPELEPGESKTVTIEGNYNVPTDVDPNSSGEIGISIYVLENNTPNFKSVSYLYIKPYKAFMNIKYDQNISSTNSQATEVKDKNIYLGASKGSVSRTFAISNGGPATMTVTAIEKPDYITVEGVTLPFTVENGTPQEITIKIEGEPGYKEGNVKFIFDGIVLCDNVTVSGDIVPDNAFFADFEDYADGLGQWFAPAGSTDWSVGQYSSSPDERLRTTANNTYWPEYNINEGRLSNGKNGTPTQALYSPKMRFNAGDKVSFYAAKKTNYGENVKLVVSYSPDRNQWTELGTITPTANGTEVNAFPGVGQYTGASGQNMLKRFEFEMPEGEYYISLAAGYVLVDNFVGGELVEVPYDIVSESAKAAGVKMVNNPVTFTASFKNINDTEVAAEDQVVTLYANGQAVATTDAQVLPVGEEVEYNLSYVPHVEGETELYAEIALGDFKVTSPSVKVKVAKESADVCNIIGTFTTGTTTTYPFMFTWTHSGAEFLYTADELKDLVGNEISKLSFMYKKDKAHDSSRVRIWMENTDDNELGSAFHEWSDEDLVFTDDDYVVSASSEYIEMPFIFTSPFTYEAGKNLRIAIALVCNTDGAVANSGAATFQTADERGSVKILKWNKDNEMDIAGVTASSTNGRQPVLYLYTSSVVPTVNGSVKDSEGAAIANAAVKAQSGEVIYETTSGEDGTWEMTIFQPELSYNLTVSAEGYEDYNGTLNLDADNDVVLNEVPAIEPEIPEGYIKVEQYLEKFSSSSVVSSRFNGPIDPLGWDKITDDKDTYKISYTANSSGKDGYCLGQTGSWEIGPYASREEAFDYIITPLVKGDLKFWLKRYSPSYEPGIKLYRMHKSEDGTFSCDPEADFISEYQPDLATDLPSSTWVEQSLNIGDNFQYIGIRMQYLYIDEFSSDEAIIPVKKNLTLGKPDYMEGYTYKINATEDGKWKVGAEIPVTNASNVPLVAEEEGENYSISLVRVISTSNPYTYEVLETVTLPDLAIGATETINVEGEFDIPEDTWSDNWSCYRFRLDFVENFTENKNSISISSWPEIIPYESILELRYDKKSTSNGSITDTQVEADKPINFGSFVGERSIDFRIKNRGAAPLVVESIDMPEWVSVEDMPESVAPGDAATIKVIISGEPGYKEGLVTFNTEGKFTSNTINLQAEVIGEDEFFADFEGEDALQGWYTPDASSNWKIGEYTSTERNYSENFYPIEYGFNNKRLENKMQTPVHYLYSPKLAFADGEKISFYATKMTNSGSDVKLIVKYSSDRVNWEELGTITVTNDNPDLQFSSGSSSSATSGGQNVMKRFEFAMPEGEYYISLGAGYVLVDNFHGGKLVDVEYDIVGDKTSVGKPRMVNMPLQVSGSFKNINSDEVSADNQTVTLYANDVAVAECEGQAIQSGETVEFNLSYTPHVAGETNLYVSISIGDYSVNTPVATVNVAEESSDVQSMIGNGEGTIGTIPFMFNWTHSGFETVYKTEQIEGLGLEGQNINRIAFPYKKSNAHGASQIQIWIENTDDTEVTAGQFYTDWTDDQLYFSKDDYVVPASPDDFTELTFVLDKPFVYEEGKNIRIRVNLICQTDGGSGNTASATFKTNTEISGLKSINWREDTFTGKYSPNNVTYQPQLVVYTEKEVSTATGTVKTATGMPIEGASVKAQSGEVIYEAVTGETGEWSMTVFQNTLEYNLTVTAEGYEDYEGVLDLEGENDIVLTPEAAPAANFTVYVYDEFEEVVDGIEVTLYDANDSNADAVYATTDENGAALFEDLHAGEYRIVVSEDQALLIERYESEMPVEHNGEDSVEITVIEYVVAPANGSYSFIPNEEEGYDVTVTWTLGEQADALGSKRRIAAGTDEYIFHVVLNGGEYEAYTEECSVMFTGLTDGEHVIEITSVSPSTKESEKHTVLIAQGTLTGILSVGIDGDDVRYFDLNGIEIHADDLENGIYIRVEGKKAEKVLINK